MSDTATVNMASALLTDIFLVHNIDIRTLFFKLVYFINVDLEAKATAYLRIQRLWSRARHERPVHPKFLGGLEGGIPELLGIILEDTGFTVAAKLTSSGVWGCREGDARWAVLFLCRECVSWLHNTGSDQSRLTRYAYVLFRA